MLFPHLIFQLLGSILRTEVPPLDLYLSDGPVPKHFDLPVQDANWLHLEPTFWLDLNHVPINKVVRVMYISLQ